MDKTSTVYDNIGYPNDTPIILRDGMNGMYAQFIPIIIISILMTITSLNILIDDNFTSCLMLIIFYDYMISTIASISLVLFSVSYIEHNNEANYQTVYSKYNWLGIFISISVFIGFVLLAIWVLLHSFGLKV